MVRVRASVYGRIAVVAGDATSENPSVYARSFIAIRAPFDCGALGGNGGGQSGQIIIIKLWRTHTLAASRVD